MDLFAEDDGGVQVGSASHHPSSDFHINESYANRFEHNKQRAELHRLEEKYGKAAADILSGKRDGYGAGDADDSDASSSSSDETEDEEGEQVTAEVDAAILRTLAKIRSGDASIYDSTKKVFDEEKALAATSASLPRQTREKTLGKGKKKMTLADYQRERLRDLMDTEEDPAKALAEATTSTTREEEERQRRADEYRRQEPLSHVQEQEQLRRQVTQAFHQIGEENEGDEEDEDEGFFTKRGDGAAPDDDPEAYKKYLLANLGQDGAEAAVRDALRYQINEAKRDHQQQQAETTADGAVPAQRTTTRPSRKSKSNGAQDNEEFLMNYILNRGWMENPQAAPKLKRPRHGNDEGDADEDKDDGKPRNLSSSNGTTTRDWEAEAADLEDAASDASFDSRAEAFEQAFNFRYEALEAGKVSDQIQSYARQHPSSSNNATVRRVEDKRKQEREERRRRKDAEKRSRMEEIDRMRELKKSSLREKLRQLKEAAGSTKLNIDEDELEGDFDEEKHDKLMKAFGDAYYGEEGDDDVKPTWDDDVDIEDILAEEGQEDKGAEEEAGPKKLSKNQRKKELRRLQELAEQGEEAEAEAQEADDAEDGADTSKLSKKDRKKLKKQAKKAAAASGQPDVTRDAEPSSSSMTPSERREAARKLADEYRSLDYEDVIGDMPTRFHYTPVTKTNYGLTPVEILLADDKDLNEVVGLKYFQPYRRGHGDRRVRKPKDLNMKLREFRRKMEEKELGKSEARRLDKERRKRKIEEMGGEAGEGGEGVKKRKGRKERQREKAEAAAAAEAAAGGSNAEAAVAAGTDPSAKSESAPSKTTAAAAEADAAEAEKAKARKEKKERNRAAKKAEAEE